MSFSAMKRNSGSDLEKLNQELAKMNSGSSNNQDERIWTCKTDKAGNGFAEIRFLPTSPQDGEDSAPWVRIWTHGFKGPGGWYIENSRTTLGQGEQDPVAEWNTELWNQGEGSEGRKRVSGSGKDNPGTKRKLNYYSNIYVVKDPANPENEGKVFLFKYGKKIFDKLNELMHPPEDPIDPKNPINPFNFWTGANFKLKIRRFEGQANYDQSVFAAPAPLLDDDDAMEEIWNKQYSLKELVAPDKFKSYEDLKKRLDRVLGNAGSAQPRQKAQEERQAWDEDASPAQKFKAKEAPKAPASTADDEDDDFAFFKSLAEDDDVPF